MKNAIQFLVLIASVVSANVYAAMVYDVTNTSVNNCSEHGLWTNQDIGGGQCSNYFSVQSGTLTIDDDSSNMLAYLTYTAVNPQGVEAQVDLKFGGFSDDVDPSHYKKESGAVYDAETMDFFKGVIGTIIIGESVYDVDTFAGGYFFQYGIGANAKDRFDLGASAWLKTCKNDQRDAKGVNACMNSNHWDININLIPRTDPSPVPVPAAFWLFASSLISVAVIGRRSSKTA